MPKRTDGPAARQPAPREDRAATEPATLDACRAEYAAADRDALDRNVRRYHPEWSKR